VTSDFDCSVDREFSDAVTNLRANREDRNLWVKALLARAMGAVALFSSAQYATTRSSAPSIATIDDALPVSSSHAAAMAPFSALSQYSRKYGCGPPLRFLVACLRPAPPHRRLKLCSPCTCFVAGAASAGPFLFSFFLTFVSVAPKKQKPLAPGARSNESGYAVR